VSDDWAEYFEANRVQWDDRAAIHLESEFYDVEGWLRDNPGPRRRELDALGAVDGLSLVHPQCHFGLDTLAFARAGATVTGLDFSPAAIAAARDIAQRAGLAHRATFVCGNVEDATTALGHATFDIVYISLGALCWLPSVARWAQAVAPLLAPGGRLYLHDGHPLAWSLADNEMVPAFTYFEEHAPFVWNDTQTYTDQQRPLEHERSYEWNHSLGEIVNALIDNGLRISRLIEHDWTVWPRWEGMVQVEGGRDARWTSPPGQPRIPLTFTLLAERPRVANPSDPTPGRPAGASPG
jgi:SAM-dependent methyltransferase